MTAVGTPDGVKFVANAVEAFSGATASAAASPSASSAPRGGAGSGGASSLDSAVAVAGACAKLTATLKRMLAPPSPHDCGFLTAAAAALSTLRLCSVKVDGAGSKGSVDPKAVSRAMTGLARNHRAFAALLGVARKCAIQSAVFVREQSCVSCTLVSSVCVPCGTRRRAAVRAWCEGEK